MRRQPFTDWLVMLLATVAAALLFGIGLAHATPGDGCYGDSYFDRSSWRCMPIHTPPPLPPQNFPPCNAVDVRFCRGWWN